MERNSSEFELRELIPLSVDFPRHAAHTHAVVREVSDTSLSKVKFLSQMLMHRNRSSLEYLGSQVRRSSWGSLSVTLPFKSIRRQKGKNERKKMGRERKKQINK